MRRYRLERGMTLIELMIVVTIIGVVAILAAVGYGRYTRTARVAEAGETIAGIKVAQENYFSQTNKYMDISQSLVPPNMYPLGTPKNGVKTDWGGPCGTCKAPWTKLGLATSGKMAFGYATVADSEATDPDAHGAVFSPNLTGSAYNWKTLNNGAFTKPWFIVTAVSDFNGDGKYTTAVSASFMSRVEVVDEP